MFTISSEDGTLAIGSYSVSPTLSPQDLLATDEGKAAHKPIDHTQGTIRYHTYQLPTIPDEGSNYTLSLSFENDRLATVTLSLQMENDSTTLFDDNIELQRMEQRHQRLQSQFGDPPHHGEHLIEYSFDWGKVGSNFDARSGASVITLKYHT